MDLARRYRPSMLPLLLNQILELSDDPILVIGRDGCIRNANTAALRLTGFAFDSLCTTHIEEILPDMETGLCQSQKSSEQSHTSTHLQANPHAVVESGLLDIRHKDRPSIRVSATVSQVINDEAVCQLVRLRVVSNSDRIDASQRLSEERFSASLRLARNWIWELDENLRFTFLRAHNPALQLVMEKQAIGKSLLELPFEFEDSDHDNDLPSAIRARTAFRDLIVRYRNDERDRYFSMSAEPLLGENDEFRGFRGISRDVSNSRHAEIRLSRLRDYYVLISETNHAIIHAKSATRLFELTCDAAIGHGRFLIAWIGVMEEAKGLVAPVALATSLDGFRNQGYPPIELSAGTRQTPAQDVLWTGEPHICNNYVAGSDDMFSCHVVDSIIGAQAIFPLRRSGQVIATLHLYSRHTSIFDDELIDLLARVGENLSFALGRFEQQAAREMAERALRESEKRFRDIADAAGGYVWENDLKGRFTYLSPRISDFLGYTPQETVGKSAAELMPPGEIARVREWFVANMAPDGYFQGLENRMLHKSGRICWQRVNGVAMLEQDGTRIGHRGTAYDVTELKESEERITRLATRDPLTDLPNRLLFYDRLQQNIDNANVSKESVAVLFIDLDRFKNTNDLLGHDMGDRLLKEVANRMSACIRSGDTLARLGGDEFVIALPHLRDPDDAAQVAIKLIQSLAPRFEFDGQLLNTSCSIGISLYPDDAADASSLLKNSDTAMYHAKDCGRNNFQYYSADMNTRALVRHEMEIDLRNAIENSEFSLQYQPQTTVSDDALVGAEALLRWHHPQRGLVSPVEFIPVAEDSGLIDAIGRWVLMEACKQARRWAECGYPSIRIAVNISAHQLIDPNAFLTFVAQTLSETCVDPQQIELEMTESQLLDHVEEKAIMLRKLGQLGIRIAVDDFGTGYSSLAYIKRLPIDSIKIDRSFVNDIETDSDDAEIIKAIIAMAHGLRLRVTAEGVETLGQLTALRKLDCDEYQGYYVSKPVDPDEFAERFLRSGSRHRSAEPILSTQLR